MVVSEEIAADRMPEEREKNNKASTEGTITRKDSEVFGIF
jgi:hypothetical protein